MRQKCVRLGQELVIPIKAKRQLKARLTLYELPGNVVPAKPDESEVFVQLWTRESLLLGSALYISAPDVEEPTVQSSIKKLIEELIEHSTACLLYNQEKQNENILIDTKKQDLKQLFNSGYYYYFRPIFLSTTRPWTLKEIPSTISQEVTKPLMSEQRQMWKIFLDMANGYSDDHINSNKNTKEDLGTEISKLVGQFDLDVVTIHEVVNSALTFSRSGKKGLIDAITDEVQLIARSKLSDLVQRITPTATLDDLVLSVKDKHLLSLIAMYVKQRPNVYQKLGFDSIPLSSAGQIRGMGITALFHGESGTGKTMAAEALARELKLDLFRVDLSMVLSKWVGETEKNLRQVFDTMQDSGGILVLDEAESFLAKRNEVKDSQDRYGNFEVAFLLQKMEAYRGLAILTTNMKNIVDPAFMRRFTFILHFQPPDRKSREDIWRRIFPKSIQIEALDMKNLSKLTISGARIRNIATNAIFLAANEGLDLNMNHLKEAAKLEYQKMERPITESEFEGWAKY